MWSVLVAVLPALRDHSARRGTADVSGDTTHRHQPTDTSFQHLRRIPEGRAQGSRQEYAPGHVDDHSESHTGQCRTRIHTSGQQSDQIRADTLPFQCVVLHA